METTSVKNYYEPAVMPEVAEMVVAIVRVAMMAVTMSVMAAATSVVLIPEKHFF